MSRSRAAALPGKSISIVIACCRSSRQAKHGPRVGVGRARRKQKPHLVLKYVPWPIWGPPLGRNAEVSEIVGREGRSSRVAREPCESRLSTAHGRAVRHHSGFISSAAFRAPEKGERRFCRAQVSCRHVRICSQLRPAPEFWEVGRGERFAFFTALFLSRSARLRRPVFANAQTPNILGKAAGGQTPRRFPRRRPRFHQAPSGGTDPGRALHRLKAPVADGFIPPAPRGAKEILGQAQLGT